MEPQQDRQFLLAGASHALDLIRRKTLVWKVTLGRSYSPSNLDCQDEETRNLSPQFLLVSANRGLELRAGSSLFACTNLGPDRKSVV
jgi:hypothetical protein